MNAGLVPLSVVSQTADRSPSPGSAAADRPRHSAVVQVPIPETFRPTKPSRNPPGVHLIGITILANARFVREFNASQQARDRGQWAVLLENGGVYFIAGVPDADRPADPAALPPGATNGLTEAEAIDIATSRNRATLEVAHSPRVWTIGIRSVASVLERATDEEQPPSVPLIRRAMLIVPVPVDWKPETWHTAPPACSLRMAFATAAAVAIQINRHSMERAAVTGGRVTSWTVVLSHGKKTPLLHLNMNRDFRPTAPTDFPPAAAPLDANHYRDWRQSLTAANLHLPPGRRAIIVADLASVATIVD